MSFRHLRRRARLAFVGAALFAIVFANAAQAHVVFTVGTDTVALGWVHEPVYVGEQNAVQAVIKDASGKPVTDLNAGDLKVVVSIGGTATPTPLDLAPGYNEDTGLGTPGDYEAPIIPTIPGDYTFHLTGSIDGTPVDETATSGDSTFDSAVDATSIQFPNQLPTVSEIVTRLQGDEAAAQSAASDAKNSASTALLVGGVVGGVGIIFGLIGIFMARQARRPSGG